MSNQSRRRFLLITGASIGIACSGMAAAAPRSYKHSKRGVLLGANAEVQIYHDDKEAAEEILQKCFEEVRRLESIFSLYDQQSDICKLNAHGRIESSPIELVNLVKTSLEISEFTDGSFDVTVQPLWDLYTDHYKSLRVKSGGPSQDDIKAALEAVNYKNISVEQKTIRFKKQRMGITLNGIAQGYITDAVTQILSESGISNMLVNMGEYRSIGTHPNGKNWQIGLADPEKPWSIVRVLPLKNKAVSTTGGYGYRFGDSLQHHHIFDPKLGRSANFYKSITVEAPSATLADGLSTAFFAVPREKLAELNFKLSDVSIYINGIKA